MSTNSASKTAPSDLSNRLEKAGLDRDAIADIFSGNNDRMGDQLFQALYTDNYAAADLILETGFPINHEFSASGDGLLMRLAKRDMAEGVRWALKNQADPNQRNKKTNETPLGYCSRYHLYFPAQELLKGGADPNVTHDETLMTPLMNFALSPRPDRIIEQLLKAGGDPNKKNKNHETALMMAIGAAKVKADFKVIDAMIKAGGHAAIANREQKSVIWFAASKNKLPEDMFVRLIDTLPQDHRQEWIDMASESGSTPLFEALYHGDVEKAKILVDAGADVNKRPLISRKGETSLTLTGFLAQDVDRWSIDFTPKTVEELGNFQGDPPEDWKPEFRVYAGKDDFDAAFSGIADDVERKSPGDDLFDIILDRSKNINERSIETRGNVLNSLIVSFLNNGIDKGPEGSAFPLGLIKKLKDRQFDLNAPTSTQGYSIWNLWAQLGALDVWKNDEKWRDLSQELLNLGVQPAQAFAMPARLEKPTQALELRRAPHPIIQCLHYRNAEGVEILLNAGFDLHQVGAWGRHPAEAIGSAFKMTRQEWGAAHMVAATKKKEAEATVKANGEADIEIVDAVDAGTVQPHAANQKTKKGNAAPTPQELFDEKMKEVNEAMTKEIAEYKAKLDDKAMVALRILAKHSGGDPFKPLARMHGCAVGGTNAWVLNQGTEISKEHFDWLQSLGKSSDADIAHFEFLNASHHGFFELIDAGNDGLIGKAWAEFRPDPLAVSGTDKIAWSLLTQSVVSGSLEQACSFFYEIKGSEKAERASKTILKEVFVALDEGVRGLSNIAHNYQGMRYNTQLFLHLMLKKEPEIMKTWVNTADADGNTPLMVAAAYGLSDMVGFCLKAGADPHAVNNLGENALHHAVMGQNDDIIKALLDSGVNPDQETVDGVSVRLLAQSERVDLPKAVLGNLNLDLLFAPCHEQHEAFLDQMHKNLPNKWREWNVSSDFYNQLNAAWSATKASPKSRRKP